MYHFIKYFIIKSIYSLISLFNFKKKFFRNDFESKIYSYNKKNSFNDTCVRYLEKKFPRVDDELRISDELKISDNQENWYQKDDLFQLSLKYRPTKRRHDYLKHYHSNFSSIRNNVKKILEIGVDRGESLNLWKEYFPNAEILGLDINPECLKYTKERIRVVIGNQNDEKFLKYFGNKEGFFDIIIDDGSHKHQDIVKSFSYLYPFVSNKGFYCVEDVINNFKTLNFFSRYTYGINYYPTAKATVDEPGYCAIDENEPGDIRNTTAVHFYRHLIFVRKGFNPEENPYKNIIKKKFIY